MRANGREQQDCQPLLAEIEAGAATSAFNLDFLGDLAWQSWGNYEIRVFREKDFVVHLSRRVKATSKKLISSNEPSLIYLHFANQINRAIRSFCFRLSTYALE